MAVRVDRGEDRELLDMMAAIMRGSASGTIENSELRRISDRL